jgi:hypothetical protein
MNEEVLNFLSKFNLPGFGTFWMVHQMVFHIAFASPLLRIGILEIVMSNQQQAWQLLDCSP